MSTNNTFLRDDGQFVGPSSGGPRPVLTTATTYYVATNGNDANSGTSSGSPWLTLAHAMSVISGQIDFGGQTVTLQAVAGHAAFTGQNLVVLPWVGGGSLIFDGGGGSITYTGVNPIDGCILIGGNPGTPSGGALTGIFKYQNITLSFTQGAASSISCSVGTMTPGVIAQMGSGVVFGASSGVFYHIFAWTSTQHQIINSFTVQSGALALLGAFHGEINTTGVAITVTFSGNMTFSVAVVWSQDPSKIYIATVTWNGAGHTITGARYLATLAGVIEGVGTLNSIGTSGGTTPNGGFVN